MGKRNFFSSLIVLSFFAAFYFMALELAPEAAYWPKLIGILGGAFSGMNMLAALVSSRRDVKGMSCFPLSRRQALRGLIVIAVLVLWLAAVPIAGYLLSSFAATCALVCCFEPVRNRKTLCRNLIVTAVFSVSIYGLFTALGVYFPDSLLM